MDDRFWYIRYFQQPGVAEAELERDLEHSLLSIYYTLSADAPPASFMKQLEHPQSERRPRYHADAEAAAALAHPRGSRVLRRAVPDEWVPGSDQLVSQHSNQQRASPLNWSRNGSHSPPPSSPVQQMTCSSTTPTGATTFPKAFDDLRFIEIVEGAGHWVQMEKPKETTALILRFLRGL